MPRGKRVKQINNLTIYDMPDDPPDRRFHVHAPHGLLEWGLLEEFSTLEAAEAWCRKTKDFLRGRTP